MLFSKSTNLIGLDIGSSSIKVVELEEGKKGRKLKNIGITLLPPNSIEEGYPKEQELIASAIKNIFKNLKINNKNVAISVSGYSVIIKKITVGLEDIEGLEGKITEKAEQYIPFDLKEVNIDFEVLESPEIGSEEAPSTRDVIVVAAKKDIIDAYMELISSAKLNPVVMDVDAFALQNAFEINMEDISGCYAIVSIGANQLIINTIKDGVSIFTRDSAYGGDQITKGIMERLGISYEDAEMIKMGGKKTENKEVIKEVFISVVSEWSKEIKRAIDFIYSTYPDETIDKVYLCGGSCRIPGLLRHLEAEIDIPVEIFNPFKSLQINKKRFDKDYLQYIAPQAAIAVGLALRSVGDK